MPKFTATFALTLITPLVLVSAVIVYQFVVSTVISFIDKK